MQNNGLPEAGDAVLTFPADIVGDPDRYAEWARLSPGDEEASAQRRQSRAVEGFAEIRAQVDAQGPGLRALAHRMGYRDGPGARAVDALLARYRDVTETVRGAYRRVLGVPEG